MPAAAVLPPPIVPASLDEGAWGAPKALHAACLSLFAAAAASVTICAGRPACAEAGIMDSLRLSVYAADPTGQGKAFGWQPGNPTQHCFWFMMRCDTQGHVQAIEITMGGSEAQVAFIAAIAAAARPGNGTAAGSGAPGPLARGPFLPDLARLQRLDRLEFMWPSPAGQEQVLAGIPPEWGHPGAFPSLVTCAPRPHRGPDAR